MTEREAQQDLIDKINKTGKYAGQSGLDIIKSSNATNVKNNTIPSQVPNNSLTPWSDANWNNLTSTNQGDQNAMEMKWNEYERATRYQTAVEDMKKAGLNPVLALTSFGGSNGSSANFSNSSKENSSRNASSILSSALAVLGMLVTKL